MNKTVFAVLALTIKWGWFKRVIVMRMAVGHTKCAIGKFSWLISFAESTSSDQKFSSPRSRVRTISTLTFASFLQAIADSYRTASTRPELLILTGDALLDLDAYFRGFVLSLPGLRTHLMWQLSQAPDGTVVAEYKDADDAPWLGKDGIAGAPGIPLLVQAPPGLPQARVHLMHITTLICVQPAQRRARGFRAIEEKGLNQCLANIPDDSIRAHWESVIASGHFPFSLTEQPSTPGQIGHPAVVTSPECSVDVRVVSGLPPIWQRSSSVVETSVPCAAPSSINALAATSPVLATSLAVPAASSTSTSSALPMPSSRSLSLSSASVPTASSPFSSGALPMPSSSPLSMSSASLHLNSTSAAITSSSHVLNREISTPLPAQHVPALATAAPEGRRRSGPSAAPFIAALSDAGAEQEYLRLLNLMKTRD